MKILTIVLLLKDIELGLKIPMEEPSVHESAIGSWLRICLFESKEHIVLHVITEPGFLQCTQNDTDQFGIRL